MSKERDWVDYANLASNLAQNLQLGGLQGRLSGLQDLAAAQAGEARMARRAIESAEKKAERIANYREVVVKGEKTLAGLHHHLPGNPLAVMALALAYRNGYKENGLSTECFPSFEEKDRVEKLFTGLDEVGEAAAEKLTPEQQNNAKLSLKYRLEEDDLKHLIELQKHREQEVAEQMSRTRTAILELKKQIEELTTKVRDAEAAVQSSSKSLWFKTREYRVACLRLLAMLGAVTFAGASAYAIFGNLGPARIQKVVWVLFWAFSLFVIFGIGALRAGSARKVVTRKMKVQSELSALQSKLTIIEASASTQHLPLSDEDKALYKKFGGGPETSRWDYERMLAERQALSASVLSDRSLQGRGNADSGATTPRPTPPIQSLPSASGRETETAASQSTTIKCPVGTTFHFDPEIPDGINLPSLKEALEFSMGFCRPSNYDEALDQLLLNGYSFIVVETPELLRVFSKKPKIQAIDQSYLRFLFEHCGIPRDMKAVWQPKAKGPSKPVRLADLFVYVDPQDF